MPNLGEQADLLRALGRLLDEQGVKRGVQITNHETYLAVGWGRLQPGAQMRPFQEHDLEELRAQARAMRSGTAKPAAPGGLAELLRTLGQELDEDRIEANGISQEGEGFRVTGVAGGRYVSKIYKTGELMQLSAQRRAMRGTGATKAADRQQERFSQVTVGMRVFSQDSVELGTVAELATASFKVQNPESELAYWLTAAHVRAVQPGAWVQLAFDRSHLDQHRNWSAPEPVKRTIETDPGEAVHDNVLWRDGGKTEEGEPIVLGPFCPRDKATLLFQPTRGFNLAARDVEPDHFIGSYTGSLVCPTCEASFLLDEAGVKRVQLSRSEAVLVLARARRRAAQSS